jgi:hypothetical protein
MTIATMFGAHSHLNEHPGRNESATGPEAAEERAHRDGAERARLQPDPGHEHPWHRPADRRDQGMSRPLFSQKSRYLRLK